MHIRTHLILAIWLCSGGVGGLAAQPAPGNPRAADQEAIRRGALLFRARCAACHGLDARGVSGPDLTAVLAAGTGDERFFRIVRSGQGTDMPRFSSEQTSDTQVREILSHLRALAQDTRAEPIQGNAENGSRIFRARCASCHRVNGSGGALGPDLSRVGSLRSPSALMAKIRDPNRTPLPGYRPVTLVLDDGRRIRGVAKNEDTFSIQIMDTRERIQGYPKARLREIVREPQSPMPSFGVDRLSESELVDLVSYLGTLRRSGAAAQRGDQ